MILKGYRILELGQVIVGAVGGMILSDLGAEVIKIESPKGDLGRNPAVADLGGVSALFVTFNRGKKSLVLDLKRPEGKEVFLNLVAVSDAVMANFRPGTMERLGLGLEALKEKNPQIVFVESSGYGDQGPWRDRPAFDIVEQSVSGQMSITGEPGRPPVRNGIPSADLSTSLYCGIACLAGLLGKAKGKGPVHLEVPMFDVQLAMLGYIATMYLNKGDLPEPPGSGHEYMVPYQAFPTKTIYIVVAPREEVFWRSMCEVMGIPELAEDPRFVTNDLRSRNRGALIPLLERIFLTKPGEEWLGMFEGAGVPAAAVNTLDRALENEQVEARGLLQSVEYPGLGAVRLVAPPILDRIAGRDPRPAPPPLLGQHSAQILKEVLNLPAEKIRSLIEAGAAVDAASAASTGARA